MHKIDLIIMRKDMLRDVDDVKAVHGLGMGLSALSTYICFL